jgi:2-polyprenyl-3-methyl-5-hydroxy-6-metoxy-1,4-benzoquinol methylase
MAETENMLPFLENDIRPDMVMVGQRQRTLNDARLLLKYEHQFVEIACPACGSRNETRNFKKYGFRYASCGMCHTIYVNPRPRPDHLAEYYVKSEDWAYWNKYVFPASEKARREKLFLPRVKALLEMCKRFKTATRTIAEVGAGFGIFCEEIKKVRVFDRVLAIEPSPDLARSCRERGIETLEQPFENVAIGDASLDVLACFEVIEHLYDPQAFLKKGNALLSSGGLLVISCPNAAGFDSVVLGEKWNAIDLGHLNLFNLDSLSMLLQTNKFRVIQQATPGRLDAELVRKEVLDGALDLTKQPFLKQILIDRWQETGLAFQNFLSNNLLSSHMLIAAQKL